MVSPCCDDVTETTLMTSSSNSSRHLTHSKSVQKVVLLLVLGRIGRLQDLAQLGHGLLLLVRSRTEPSLVGRSMEATVISQTLVSLNMAQGILLLLVVLLLKILLFLFVIVSHCCSTCLFALEWGR